MQGTRVTYKRQDLMIYQIVLGNDYQRFELNYELNDNEPTKIWSELARETRPSDLRSSLNPWRGNRNDYDSSVKELFCVIEELNEWLPEKIYGKWDYNNPIKSLNNLHIHFPEHEKSETDSIKRKQLTRFNDLIHGLGVIIGSKHNEVELLYLLLCCDSSRRVNLEEHHFNFFQPKVDFGDLTLHYCHVGRHPLELVLSNDTDCPADQIIPQYQISAYHTLRFFQIQDTTERFKNFYTASKLNWPYTLTDKRLALGYINLGKLTTINGKKLERAEIISTVKNCNTVLDWQFL